MTSQISFLSIYFFANSSTYCFTEKHNFLLVHYYFKYIHIQDDFQKVLFKFVSKKERKRISLRQFNEIIKTLSSCAREKTMI